MFEDRRAQLKQQKIEKIAMVTSVKRMKLDNVDGLSLCDAGMDIREIDARLDELARVERDGQWVRIGPPVPLSTTSTPSLAEYNALTGRMPSQEPPTVPLSVRSSVCEASSGSFRCVLPNDHEGPHRSDEWTMPNPRQPLA